MPIYSNEDIIKEVRALRDELAETKEFVQKKFIGSELSLNEFACILGQDPRTVVKQYIKTGMLKARKINTNKAKAGYSYNILDTEAIRFLKENHTSQVKGYSVRTANIKEIIENLHKEGN